MLDLLLAVNDTRAWHKENLKLHPTDYSSLRIFGEGMVNRLQESGPGVIYNPYVTINGRVCVRLTILPQTFVVTKYRCARKRSTVSLAHRAC